MRDDTYDHIRQAIINKMQVLCDFGGLPREVCPHVIGTKNGRAQVLVYQFGGRSSSGLPPEGEWRCMPVERISNVQLREGKWYTGHRHTEPQTCVDEIDVEVDY